MIEILELRVLCSSSGYPVAANSSAVLADMQHSATDTARLSSDRVTFAALLAADKKDLKTTLTQDKAVVHADQATVKADKNSPTLLAPAQLALENAIVKLNADTAALKTRLAQDSATRKTTLSLDDAAVRTDRALLKTDTSAAQALERGSISRLRADLSAIQAAGNAPSTVINALELDLIAAGQGQVRPTAADASAAAGLLSSALDNGALSSSQQTACAQDLVDVANSGGVSATVTSGTIADMQSLLQSGGSTVGATQQCVAELRVIATDVGG